MWCGVWQCHLAYYTRTILPHIGSGTLSNVSDSIVDNLGAVVFSLTSVGLPVRDRLLLDRALMPVCRFVVAVTP